MPHPASNTQPSSPALAHGPPGLGLQVQRDGGVEWRCRVRAQPQPLHASVARQQQLEGLVAGDPAQGLVEPANAPAVDRQQFIAGRHPGLRRRTARQHHLDLHAAERALAQTQAQRCREAHAFGAQFNAAGGQQLGKWQFVGAVYPIAQLRVQVASGHLAETGGDVGL